MRSSCWLVALIVSGVIVLAGAPGAMAAGWRPPVDISSPQTAGADPGCSFICFGNYPGAAGADIAVNARGDAMAAWIRRTGSGTAALQTAFRPAGGSFGAPQTVGPSQGLYFFGFLGPLADVAMDNQGNAVVVWPATKNGRTVVESSVRPAGGNFGAPVDLTADDLSANTDPRVAISPGTNEAVAVWTRSNGSKTVVQSSTKPVGGAFAPAINLSDASLNSSAARIALNPSGAAAVTWLQSDGSNNLVRARTRPAGGVFAATQTLSAAGRDATEPDVVIDDAGRATVVWSRYDGTQTRVQSRFLTAAGGIGAGIDDVSNNARDALSPRVALDSENTAVAVWRACDTGTSSGCVVESATRPSGGSFGSVDAVGPPSDSSFTLPRVAMDPGGTATAVWSDFGGARIRTSRRPRNGSFGSVDEISPATGQALEPAVSTDNEGSAVAAWAYTRPDGNQVAQAAVFDAGAPALSNVNVPATLTTGVPADMSATATDRWSGVSFTWDFGDGATASGSGVSHAYGAPGVYTAVVRATDAAGNSSSVSRTIQVSNPTPPPPPPPPAAPKRIVITMPFFVKKSTKKYTVFTQLDVKGIPSGSTLKVTCKAPKGKKCPAKSFTKRNARGKVSLKKWLKKRLPAGAKLTATVTKTGNFIGAVKIMTVKKRARPSFVDRCLPPGAKKPAKC